MIKTENLEKYFNKGRRNEIHVINDNNIELPNTGFITILGESGSGKTTLLNVIGGLDRFSGTIQYDDIKMNGYHMNKIDEYRTKNIGYIFQNYNLLSDLSIYDNLKLQLDIIDITDKDEVKKRIDYALSVVGLYRYRKKKPNELSGGQQQRVSIARALVKKYKILICDEPTGNLDSQNSLEIMKILKKISKTSLVLLVTHDKKLAEFYSDRIYNIVDGKITDIVEQEKSNRTLNYEDNTIYLNDMNVKEFGDEVKTTVYSNEDIKDINIELVNVNGTYYLKSNVNIKFQESVNFKFEHKKKEIKTLEQIEEDTVFDTSNYKDIYEKNVFKKMLALIKEGFINFKNASKKAKFFRVIFVIIGILIGILDAMILQNLKRDTSNFLNDDRLYFCENNNDESYIEDKYIDKKYGISVSYSNFNIRTTNYTTEVFEGSFYVAFQMDLAKKTGDLLYGNWPENITDCVVDNTLAKRIKNQFKLKTIEDIIGIDYIDGKIVGILDADTNMLYRNLDPSISVGSPAYLLTKEDVQDLIDHDYTVKNVRQLLFDQMNKLMKETSEIMTIVSVVLAGVIILYVFFTMRSRLISDVKRIGILRSIGMQKKRIQFTNAVEIFLITLLFGVTAFLITIGIIQYFSNEFSVMGIGLLLYQSYITYIILFAFILMTLIIGLLPTFMLLRKTPQEINTKYDI